MCKTTKLISSIFSFQAEKKGLVMVNFFSYFLTCSNHSTIKDVIGKAKKNLGSKNCLKSKGFQS